ncbi:MAG TPA: hypothetical protein DEA08_16755 [Planctomycetes bacterium]|nr:hypothetical protein [Planctomycetota bacterium]
MTLDSPATSKPIYKRVFHVIAVGTASGRVYFVSDSGDVRGSFGTDNPVTTPPYFYGDRFCLIGSTDNRLYCVDWKEKVPKELHRIDLGSDVVAGPVPLGRRLLVGTSSGQVHLISVSSAGQLKDEQLLGEAGTSAVKGIQVAGEKFYFTAGRRLFAGTNDDAGARLTWKAPFNAPADLSEPRVPFEGDMIYVGCEDGTLYAVDKNTGEVRWRFSVPGEVPIHHAPLISGSELYVVAGDRIHVLAAD